MCKLTIAVLFLVLVLFNVCDGCAPFNSVNVRTITRILTRNLTDFEKLAHIKLQYIQPGTKWCGAGNTADSYDDLGPERSTDMCCRDHDNCPDIISAGESKHNLTNEAFYTRLSCDCDEIFRKCLRDANSGTANNIGTVYFNALATKCFRKDYPTIRCVKRGGWLNRKCLKYTYNTNAEMLYQWFDVNNY